MIFITLDHQWHAQKAHVSDALHQDFLLHVELIGEAVFVGDPGLCPHLPQEEIPFELKIWIH